MSKRKWLSWQSRIMPIWLWHAMFDGTRLCGCEHSLQGVPPCALTEPLTK